MYKLIVTFGDEMPDKYKELLEDMAELFDTKYGTDWVASCNPINTKLTNREWLESLSDDLFATRLRMGVTMCELCVAYQNCYGVTTVKDCDEKIKNWLQQEHKE